MNLKAFMGNLIQLALSEINEEKGTNYQLKDVDIAFKREIVSNEVDNATIDKLNAETKQIEINNLLAAASQIDSETLLEKLCGVMDLDFEEIKGKVDLDDPRMDLNMASELLGVDNELPATASWKTIIAQWKSSP